jgi:hypothetical protein
MSKINFIIFSPRKAIYFTVIMWSMPWKALSKNMIQKMTPIYGFLKAKLGSCAAP